MREIISETDERYFVLDFCLFLVPAANLNRPVRTAAAPSMA
ncbi:hypothetical protein [Roseovarius sp. M141]|nr:hypothetical protein [Roseovarius sp. M141]